MPAPADFLFSALNTRVSFRLTWTKFDQSRVLSELKLVAHVLIRGGAELQQMALTLSACQADRNSMKI